MKHRTTIKDVADLAGVSKATVSNLLNRKGQKYFGELLPNSFLNTGGDQIGRRYQASARVRF